VDEWAAMVQKATDLAQSERQREINARVLKIREYGRSLESQLHVKEERKRIAEVEKEQYRQYLIKDKE
jgi:hypothetical protein